MLDLSARMLKLDDNNGIVCVCFEVILRVMFWWKRDEYKLDGMELNVVCLCGMNMDFIGW